MLRDGDTDSLVMGIALWRTCGCPDVEGEEPAIPPLVRETLDEYVRIGRPPGGFVRAVLENKLIGAYGAADQESTAAMHAIVMYVYHHVPEVCLGSREVVDAWIAQGGIEGMERAAEVEALAEEADGA